MAFDLNDEELKATREWNGADKKVMSEQEIIKYFKEVISWYRENTPDRVYALNNKDIEMIQGLLDLYNKEKEKNKNLNKYITDKVKTGKKIQTFINKGYVEQEYISKDKIREIANKRAETDGNYRKAYYEILELLEERN